MYCSEANKYVEYFPKIVSLLGFFMEYFIDIDSLRPIKIHVAQVGTTPTGDSASAGLGNNTASLALSSTLLLLS